MLRVSGLGAWSTVKLTAVILASLAYIPLAASLRPIDGAMLPELLYLGIGTQVAALMPIRWGADSGLQFVYTPTLLAAGLAAPGAGVALVVWIFLFDGRVPGRDVPVMTLIYARANTALAHGIPSLVLSYLPLDGALALPVKALLYSLGIIAINYPLTGLIAAQFRHTSVRQQLRENVRLSAVVSLVILGYAGGILYLLLRTPAGYLMAPGLVGFLVAVRANMAYGQEQARARVQTLELAAYALDVRDSYTESHSVRVAQLAVKISEKMDLSRSFIEQIRTAGTLHDIGKLGIRDEILHKPALLTAEEWAIMKTHPDVGAEMILKHSALAPVAPLVRHHHERWNGTGYPGGLSESAIPLGSRILAVADSFDTMTGPRLYRQTFMTPAEAVVEISGRAASWYDPAVVNGLRAVYGHAHLALPQRDDIPVGRPATGIMAVVSRHPQFRVFWLGGGVSSLGDPLTTVATLVSVYAVTRQPLAVAAVYMLKAVATLVTSSLIGQLSDKLLRRDLIVSLELVRACVLVFTPLLLTVSVALIFPIVVALASANAIVQPARQAAIPSLVSPDEVGAATGAVQGINMLTNIIGFPLAGVALWLWGTTTVLFWMDAGTFTLAALMTLSVGQMGGAAPGRLARNAVAVAWSVPDARAHLLLITASALLGALSYPALIALGYLLSRSGAQAYTILEGALAIGFVLGTLVVARWTNIGRLKTAGWGLFLMGLFSLAVGGSPWLLLTALLLLMATVGNPIVAISNQTALLALANETNRGRVMGGRIVLIQAGILVGSAIGGITVAAVGPHVTYAVLGTGLLALSFMARRAGSRAQRLASDRGVELSAASEPMPQRPA